MNFAAIPAGASVFLDANVFIYDFGPDPILGPPSRSLLERVERSDIKGFISAHVLNDIAHRLMTLEACQIFGWPYTGIGQKLRKHPAEIGQLTRSRQALDDIIAIGIQVLDISMPDVLSAADLSRQLGLLSGDALAIAVMRSNKITELASNDSDFDRVPGVTRYTPL
jgi:predicted nucleic acid-binding protein